MLGWGSAPEPFYPDEKSPSSAQDYTSLAEESWGALESYRNSLEGWTPVQHDTPGVQLFEKPTPDSSLPMFRVEGTLPASLDEVYPMLNSDDIQEKKKYDTFIKTSEVIEQVTSSVSVVYLQYNGMLTVAGRDFIAMKANRELEDGTKVIYGQSINHKARPITNAFVRAKGKFGFYCSPVKGEPFVTRIFGILSLNPMAYIPAWLINLGKAQAPKALRVLGKILIERYGKPELREPPSRPPLRLFPALAEVDLEPLPVESSKQVRMVDITQEVRSVITQALQVSKQLNEDVTALEGAISQIDRWSSRLLKVGVSWSLFLWISYHLFVMDGKAILVSLLSWFTKRKQNL
eukprot:TRINITY_DN2775_c7_g1_i1.p1 TRINITY_DN2775_c7_g1~~TRINITY_DN2775_c7_g1_i1.p1  ORF type:complete len:348 (-),score=71.42 TRINITY_DN2775_c7_g1_i1:30-1073(-)